MKKSELKQLIKEEIQKIINEASTNLEDLQKERDHQLEQVKHWSAKYRTERQPYQQKFRNEAERKLRALDKQIEKFPWTEKQSKIRKIVKSFHLEASKNISTSIRGYSRPTTGYSFSDYDPTTIEFNGIRLDQFNQIVSAIEAAGISIANKQEPSKVLGQGSHSTIKIK